MQLLTPEGSYAPAQAATFSGGDALMPSSVTPGPQGWRSLRLVDGPGGQVITRRFAEIYRTNPWVWTCVRLKSVGTSRLPLHVFEFDADGNAERVRPESRSLPGRPTGPQQLVRILEQPLDNMSRRAWVQRVKVDRGVYGNALTEIVKGRGGLPMGLRFHRWGSVTPVLSDDGRRVEYFEVPDGPHRTRELPPADVIHFGQGDDPDSPLGVSPIQALTYTNMLYDAVGRYLRGWFSNQAAPSGHVQLPKGADTNEARRVRQMLADFYTSPENAGKVLATTGDWKSVAETPQHSEVIQLVKLSREEVCAGYGIPTPIAGILDRAVMANVHAMREQYVRDVLGPEASEFEDELESQLIGRWPAWRDLQAEFLMAEQLRPDMVRRAEAYERQLQWQTIDEIRSLENLPPLNIPGVTDVPILKPGVLPAGQDLDDEPDLEFEDDEDGDGSGSTGQGG